MKKLIKILSTVFALSISIIPTSFADGETSGATEKATAQYFHSIGPLTSWHPYFQRYTSDDDVTKRPVTILLDNEAARQQLIRHYEEKGLTKQVEILKSHPDENLFMIWHEDWEEISGVIETTTANYMEMAEPQFDGWCANICEQSKLKAQPARKPQGEFGPLELAGQRDLRQGSKHLGKAWFAWSCKQTYFDHFIFPE